MDPIGLVKLYEVEQHAHDLLNGTMFANPVSYYKRLESENKRRDTEEGSTTFPLTDDFRMEIATADKTTRIMLDRADLAEAPILRPHWFSSLNLFCLHIATIRAEGDTGIVTLASTMAKFGVHGVIISDPEELVRRVQKATDRNKYRLGYGQVKYYDPKIGIETNPTTLQPLLTKRNRYRDEREFRFIIDRGLSVPNALKLDIGSIHDIASYVKIDLRK